MQYHHLRHANILYDIHIHIYIFCTQSKHPPFIYTTQATDQYNNQNVLFPYKIKIKL